MPNSHSDWWLVQIEAIFMDDHWASLVRASLGVGGRIATLSAIGIKIRVDFLEEVPLPEPWKVVKH